MSKTKIGIINVTGYVGIELARILSQHPEVDLVSITGRSAAGQKIGKVFPSLAGLNMTIDAKLGDVDIAFSAMPHGESAAEVIPLINCGKRVIDMSGDFRLKDAGEWQIWYGHAHPNPQMIDKAVYGIPELHAEAIHETALVANPGCYSTGAILAMAPAAKAGIIEPDIIVDSKSGVSGAGRSLKLTSHFCEVDEDVCAYSVEGHRLMPEMVQEIGLVYPGPTPRITFMPHLIPMNRGIFSTCYATLKMDKLGSSNPKEALKQLYRDFYADLPFVKVVDEPPHTKHVQGSNYCHIYTTVDSRTGKLIVLSVIDNLVKGAAGQGVQNMNVMLGLPETTGLSMPGLYP
jgi:N-acetyl-gamma-glutamyl-phosphate reductase